MSEDAELLGRYASEHSESAFSELIRRHVDLVYSAALRLAGGDTHRAEDVTQQVFAELARQAQRLRKHPALDGWLYTTTRLLALRARRTEQRRKAREQAANAMNELLRNPAPEPAWDDLLPVLDEAMHKLGEKDRVAVLLRYFQNKSLKEVGTALGLSENAARMRVERALEKLRAQLARNGVTSTAAALALALTGNATTAAPAAFVATLTSAAFAGGAAASGTTLTLVKIMTMTKLKTGVISSIAVAGAVTSLVIQQQSQAKIRESDAALQQQADQLARLQTDRERLSNLLARANGPAADDRLTELLRLRAEAAILRQQTNDIAALQEENRRLQEQNAQQTDQLKTPLQLKDESYARSRAAKNFLLAFILYAGDNQNQFPASFDQAVRYFPDAFNADPVSGDLAEFIQATNQFEVVYRGSRDALTNAGNVIVLRERQARQWPDGNWSKVYGFADGHSETHGEAEGNFDAWEKQRIVTPASQ